MEVFYTVLKDGVVEEERTTMGCFGATGRSDWNRILPEFESELEEFADNTGIAGPTGRDTPFIPWDSKDVLAIRLRALGSVDNVMDGLFDNLFHIRMLGVWKYLTSSPIFGAMFTQTPERIINDNYVEFLVDKVPSEVQTWLHIACRDHLSSPAFGMNFDFLVSQGIEEGLAFAMSIRRPWLYLNKSETKSVTECQSNSFDYTPFVTGKFRKGWVFPRTMKELGGYAMNINRLFKASTSDHSYLTGCTTDHTVKGLFTTQNISIINPKKFADNIKAGIK